MYVYIYVCIYIYVYIYINNIFIMYTYTPPPHPTPQEVAGRHTYIKTCGHTDICTDTHDHDHLGGGGGLPGLCHIYVYIYIQKCVSICSIRFQKKRPGSFRLVPPSDLESCAGSNVSSPSGRSSPGITGIIFSGRC